MSCIWEIKAEYGTKLFMEVNKKDVDYACNANRLTIKSKEGTMDYKSSKQNKIGTISMWLFSTEDNGDS